MEQFKRILSIVADFGLFLKVIPDLWLDDKSYSSEKCPQKITFPN